MLKFDDEYWFIDNNGLIYSTVWIDCYTDNCRLSIGNVFRTREEAEYEAERLKVVNELKSFSKKFERYEGNYCINYDMINKKISVYNNYFYATSEIVFKTGKDAENAIEAVGKERILKYYLGVEE